MRSCGFVGRLFGGYARGIGEEDRRDWDVCLVLCIAHKYFRICIMCGIEYRIGLFDGCSN